MGNFSWDDRLGRFRDKRNGQFVSQERVKRELERFRSGLEGAMLSDFDQLNTRQISHPEFERRMQRHIKNLHGSTIALRAGGFARMKSADWGRVGGIVASEYRYLRRLINDYLEKGAGGIQKRIRHFAAQYRRYEAIEQLRQFSSRGFTEVMNILNPNAEHCRPHGGRPSCESISNQWMPINEMIDIGQRACFNGCQCLYIFRNPETGEVAR